MTLVKICGITDIEDAVLARDLGAMAIGLNFVPASPRYVTPEAAREIVETLSSTVECIGVFVNESPDMILAIAEKAKLDGLQLHGDESAAFVHIIRKESGLKVIKAFRISDDFDRNVIDDYEADGVLLDSFSRAAYGGTGETFDWAVAASLADVHTNVFLAGGIDPENIAQAIEVVCPFAVDVCSGVECSKGKKDPEKMKELFAVVNRLK